jgi:hypothetical protein
MSGAIGYSKAPSSLRFAGAVHDNFVGSNGLREKAVILD